MFQVTLLQRVYRVMSVTYAQRYVYHIGEAWTSGLIVTSGTIRGLSYICVIMYTQVWHISYLQ